MPLQELSTNLHIVRGHVRKSSKANSDAVSNTSSIPPAPPRMVQSMLRNTTELGDIGIAWLGDGNRNHTSRHTQAPQSSPSFATSSQYVRGSLHDVQQRQEHQQSHQHLQPGLQKYVSQQNYHHARKYQGRRRPRPPPLMTENASMASLHPRFNRVQSYRSLSTFRSLDEMRRQNSVSPFSHDYNAERSRWGRLGSIANATMYPRSVMRHPLDASGRISMASSSASMGPSRPYHPSRMFPPANWSSGSLTQMPIEGRGGSNSIRKHVLGSPAQISEASVRANAIGSYGGRSLVSFSSIPPSPPPSAGPYYYDYSEPFIDEYLDGYAGQVPTGSCIDNADEGYSAVGISTGSSLNTKRERSAHSPKVDNHSRNLSKQSNRTAPSPIPRRKSSLRFAEFTMAVGGSIASIKARNMDKMGTQGSKHGTQPFSPISTKPANTSDESGVPPEPSTIVSRANTIRAEPLGGQDVKFNPIQVGDLQLIDPKSGLRATQESAQDRESQSYSKDPIQPRLPDLRSGRLVSSRAQHVDERGAKDVTPHIYENSFFDKQESGVNASPELQVIPHRAPSNQPDDIPSDLQDTNTTPRRDNRRSTMPSHGKSTIESLLDKHIESLGIGPEPESPSERPPTLSTGTRSIDGRAEHTDQSRENHFCQTSASRDSLVLTRIRKYNSLENVQKIDLIPKRLFANSLSTTEENTYHIHSRKGYESTNEHNRPSYGWQTLASMSTATLNDARIKTTESSGNLADIDSSTATRRFKMKNRSTMSLSDLSSGAPSLRSLALSRSEFGHKRSRSELIARQESHRRRRLRIRIKLERLSRNISDAEVMELKRIDNSPRIQLLEKPQAVPGSDQDYDTPHAPCNKIVGPISSLRKSDICELGLSTTPKRWPTVRQPPYGSEVIITEIPRQSSVRTAPSYRSEPRILQPINSARLVSRTPKLGNTIPILAPPDLGPPLKVSDWDLSIPYAPEPSTIRPSFPETRSFFEESPMRHVPRGVRKLFGLASLRSVLSGSSGLALPGVDTFPAETRNLSEWGILSEDSLPRTDSASKRERILARVRTWWRSRCLQKRVSLHQRKGVNDQPGGILV